MNQLTLEELKGLGFVEVEGAQQYGYQECFLEINRFKISATLEDFDGTKSVAFIELETESDYTELKGRPLTIADIELLKQIL